MAIIIVLCLMSVIHSAVSEVGLTRGGENYGPIAQFVPNDIGNTVENTVQCFGCSDTDVLSWELPNEEILDQSNMVSNTLGAEVFAQPGSLTLSATGGVGTLPEGVYTCRILDANGDEQNVFLYLLDFSTTPGITEPSCMLSSLDPLTFVLSFSIMGFAPILSNCTKTAEGPILTVTDSNSPTTTDLAFHFQSTMASGSITCEVSNGGSIATANCSFSTQTISTPAPPISGTQLLISSTDTILPPFSQTISHNIDSANPIWCQSSDPTAVISWILPSGATLSAGSPPVDGVAIISGPNSLGLYPASLGSTLPPGIYTCVIDGVSMFVEIDAASNFLGPFVNNEICQLMTDPLTIKISAAVSDGLANSVTCIRNSDRQTVLSDSTITPTNVMITIAFVPGEFYICSISNNFGSTAVACGTDIVPSATPTGVIGIRDPSDPTRATITWVSSSDPSVTGYIIAIGNTDSGTIVIDSVNSTTTTIDIPNLDPNNGFIVTVTAFGESGPFLSLPSDPVTIPAVDIGDSQCQAAKGHQVEICVRRALQEGDEGCECENEQAGFMQAVFEEVLLGTGSLADNCSYPMVNADRFKCKEREGTPRRENSRERSRERSKETSRGRSRGTKTKSNKEKSNKEKSNRRNEKTMTNVGSGMQGPFVEVCVNGYVMCDSCETFNAQVGKRFINRRLRERRTKKPKKEKSGVTKSRSVARIVNDVQGRSVEVGGKQYSVAKVKPGRDMAFFCGITMVDEGTACDCPGNCPP